MSILETKEVLKSKGYCSFNLKDFNEEYFNYINHNFKCNENKNLKEIFKYLRADYRENYGMGNQIHIQEMYKSIDESIEVKNKIVNGNNNITQVWHYCEGHGISKVIEKFDLNKLKKVFDDIAKYFFDLDDEVELGSPIQFTYYDIGCRLNNHSDGTGTGRICACLIYFNENYDQKDGGCLILNNEMLVIPEIGNVAIIDLQSFDIPHMVTEVTGGLGRFAALCFVKRKEDVFK